MAYDDGYYYGQCKIVAVVDNAADNGKTVLITTDDNKTYSGIIANKRCEFLLPPRTLYTVQKVSSGSAEFTTKVEAGYGDCILVHLDTGYVEVKQGDIVGLDYIKAATDDNLKNKVPEAKAVKELNSSLGTLSFGQDDNGNWGYRIAGADPVIPFKSGTNFGLISLGYKEGTKTFTINTKGKDILYYSTNVISPSTIKIIKNGTTTSLSNDSVPLKSSGFAAIIVDGVTLAHSIDVSNVDEITVSCYSNTSANNACDFIYSFENIAKLESNYILYAK